MTQFDEIVKAKMLELGISRQQLAIKMGVTIGSINHWLNYERTPSLQRLATLERVLNMPTGTLIMSNNIVTGESITKISAKGLQNISGVFMIPLLTSLKQIQKMGGNTMGIDCKEFLPIKEAYLGRSVTQDSEIFLWRVSGYAMHTDSISNYDMRDGDFAVIERNHGELNNNDIILVKINDSDIKIRRYSLDGGEIWLFAADKHYPPIKFTDDMEILGRVIGISCHRPFYND